MIEVEVRACWLISAPKRHLSRRTLITDLGSFCGIGKVTTLNPTAKRKKKKRDSSGMLPLPLKNVSSPTTPPPAVMFIVNTVQLIGLVIRSSLTV